MLRRPARMIADEALDGSGADHAGAGGGYLPNNGIMITGGGSQLWGMDQMIAERTDMACTIADDPDSCVAYGCGKSLAWINHMQEGTINLARRKLLKD